MKQYEMIVTKVPHRDVREATKILSDYGKHYGTTDASWRSATGASLVVSWSCEGPRRLGREERGPGGPPRVGLAPPRVPLRAARQTPCRAGTDR